MSEVVVETGSGRMRGVALSGGVRRFLGIPYAAPPTGARRFAKPEPHPGWSGVRDATRPGPTAPQRLRPFTAIDMSPLLGAGWLSGDDYLTAAIWTRGQAGANLPVMVFIHGGAFVAGCNDTPAIDGQRFAEHGVVLVSINYRLGIEGFLPIDGAPTNIGLRDQIAALRWVNDNIAAFGGDPANVTLFGESAGAMSVANLLAAPAAAGLFRRAIIQSGHGSAVRTIADTRPLTIEVARILGITADADSFRATTVEQCLDALEQVQDAGAKIDLRDADGHDPAFGLTRFLPVYDDDILPRHPLTALAAGDSAAVDVLIGSNVDELNLYFVPGNRRAAIDGALATALLQASTPHGAALMQAYGGDDPARSAGDLLAAISGDLAFRAPARAFACAHRGTSHVYEFDWKSPACDGALGACHALDIPFVFDTLDRCGGANGILGGAAPVDIARRIHGLWVDFAHGIAPPWPAHDAGSRLVQLLGSDRLMSDRPLPLS